MNIDHKINELNIDINIYLKGSLRMQNISIRY